MAETEEIQYADFSETPNGHNGIPGGYKAVGERKADTSKKEAPYGHTFMRRSASLRQQLDTELEWKDYEIEGNVRQDDYEHLVKQSDTEEERESDWRVRIKYSNGIELGNSIL